MGLSASRLKATIANEGDSMKIYDAVVVGSGASGGWGAKELTEQGMEVLMVEAGAPADATPKFFVQPWPNQPQLRGFSTQKARTENPSPDRGRVDSDAR